MDILIRFRRKSTTPADYVRTELDMLDVSWDDVDEGFPFFIEGSESIILGIIQDAQRDENVETVIVL